MNVCPWFLLVMTNKTQNCDLEIVSLVKSNFNFTGKTLIAIVVSHVVAVVVPPIAMVVPPVAVLPLAVVEPSVAVVVV
jgi:hypothetical protein